MQSLQSTSTSRPTHIRASSSNASKRVLPLRPYTRALSCSSALFLKRRAAGAAQRNRLSVTAQPVAEPQAADTYSCPTWTAFEFGVKPVYWTPEFPKPGETMTVYYNSTLTDLQPEEGDYVAFNGGFNGPFMCGGEPRPMSMLTECIYAIRVKVPQAACFLQVSFTDGKKWDESYKILVEQPRSLRDKETSYFNQLLEKEMGRDGACAEAIFPDPAPVPDRCALPGAVGLVGQSCELDIIPGCRDPQAANFDPMATVDDQTCEI